jgi:glycosyltransferase involved in cell wall biosynthesis
LYGHGVRSNERAGGTAARRDLVVIVAGTPFHGMRRGSRGLTDALSQQCAVLYVDPPRSMARRPYPVTARLSVETSNVYRLAPVALPGMTRPVVRSLTRTLLVHAIRQATKQIGSRRTVVLQQTASFPVLGECGERTSVYYVTDDYTAGADLLGGRRGRLERAERRAADRADMVIAVSPRLAEKWRDRGKPVVVIRNGVDAAAFDHPHDLAHVDVQIPSPIAGIVGTLSERINLDLLEHLVDTGSVSLLLVGQAMFRSQKSRFERLLERSNVQWLGQQDFARLPAIYEIIDVGLLPYTHSAFNQASDPLKLLEYLAAGKPVVGTGLPAVVGLAAPDVVIADDPASFAEAVLRSTRTGRDRSRQAMRRSFARGHSWERRADELRGVLGLDC